MVDFLPTNKMRLAQAGGQPVRSSPFPAWPQFREAEKRAVLDVLNSGRVNYWSGHQCRRFEEEFARYCGAEYGVAVANGTVALELAVHALGIAPGDEVIVTPRTFIASVSSVILRGARPVFADVDPESQNISAESIRRAFTPNTKAIIAVHLAGWPCDMDPILELAGQHQLKVIEDCAQAHGAMYKGRQVGSFGDAAAFSFCEDKIITTGGEGGILLTSDRTVWKRAWSYKDHGKSYETVCSTAHPPGFRWLHESFGTNWRMTEMQAAIGRVQHEQLESWLERRRENAAILAKCFRDIPALRTTEPPPYIRHANYRYFVFVRPERLRSGWDRDRIMTAINDEGIPCYTGFCPEVYLEKAFESGDFRPPERLPVARQIGDSSLMFLVHPGLIEQDMMDTCLAVQKVMEAASF